MLVSETRTQIYSVLGVLLFVLFVLFFSKNLLWFLCALILKWIPEVLQFACTAAQQIYLVHLAILQSVFHCAEFILWR